MQLNISLQRVLNTLFPLTAYQIIVLDSPFLFSACWQVIKLWIGELYLSPPAQHFHHRSRLLDFVDAVSSSKVLFIERADLKKYIEPQRIISELQVSDPVEKSEIVS